MKFYINTIEQINTEDGVNEYAKVEKYDSEGSARTKYYERLANVSASIEKGTHLYMSIKIVNSYGCIVKEDMLGSYKVEEE